jgi:hypothetical protein
MEAWQREVAEDLFRFVRRVSLVRAQGTDFVQAGFEPGRIPTALKPAVYLGF